MLFQKDTFFEAVFVTTGIGLADMISLNDLSITPDQLRSTLH